MDKSLYMPEVEAGFVSRTVHPENPNIVILNYTQECVFSRRWNDVTLACRGLILNEATGEVLARPFRKFFNYGEDQEAVVPPGHPEVTVKQDGSLGISYVLDDKLRWSTRGSFVSEQSKAAQSIWEAKYAQRYAELDGLFDHVTLLVEIIHPSSRVVVNYNFSDLVLLGAISTHDGHDYDYAALVSFANALYMRVTPLVEGGLSEMLALAKTLTANEEGFVLRWPNGYRLKVKGDRYLEVHRILYGLSAKQKARSWAEGNLESLMAQIPEEFRREVEVSVAQCENAFAAMKREATSHFQEDAGALAGNRKEYALWVIANVSAHLRPFMFLMLNGKDVDVPIKEYIAKNYRDYVLEVFDPGQA